MATSLSYSEVGKEKSLGCLAFCWKIRHGSVYVNDATRVRGAHEVGGRLTFEAGTSSLSTSNFLLTAIVAKYKCGG